MPDQRYEAFSTEFPYIAFELYTKEVVLFHPADMDRRIEVIALWDTGATISSIAPGAVKKLGLVPIDSVTIEGVNSFERCDQVLISWSL
jgi:hypothetical protein